MKEHTSTSNTTPKVDPKPIIEFTIKNWWIIGPVLKCVFDQVRKLIKKHINNTNNNKNGKGNRKRGRSEQGS